MAQVVERITDRTMSSKSRFEALATFQQVRTPRFDSKTPNRNPQPQLQPPIPNFNLTPQTSPPTLKSNLNPQPQLQPQQTLADFNVGSEITFRAQKGSLLHLLLAHPRPYPFPYPKPDINPQSQLQP